MNIKELKERLINEKIPQEWWGLPNQSLLNSAFWLERNDIWGGYNMYYRNVDGVRYEIKNFFEDVFDGGITAEEAEQEACEFFYNYVTREYKRAIAYKGNLSKENKEKMNMKELKEKLIKENIPQLLWGLPDQFNPVSEFWLEKNEGGVWNVYIIYYQDERGNRHIIETFLTEGEACEFFYNYVTERYEEAKPYIGKGKDL
jgi:hypothetical protein